MKPRKLTHAERKLVRRAAARMVAKDIEHTIKQAGREVRQAAAAKAAFDWQVARVRMFGDTLIETMRDAMRRR